MAQNQVVDYQLHPSNACGQFTAGRTRKSLKDRQLTLRILRTPQTAEERIAAEDNVRVLTLSLRNVCVGDAEQGVCSLMPEIERGAQERAGKSFPRAPGGSAERGGSGGTSTQRAARKAARALR